MFLRDLTMSLQRRWYLTIAGLIATALLCFGASVVVSPTYEAKASLLLLPPADSVEGGGNYLLQLGGLEGVVAILNRTLNSQSANDAIKKVAPGATYTVAPDYTTSGPIIIITADDKTPETTLKTLTAVSDLAGPSLANLQQSLGIGVSSRIRSTPLDTDLTPTTIRKTQVRALVIAAAGGLVGSALLIGLVDSWLLRRRRISHHHPTDQSSADESSADHDPEATDRGIRPPASKSLIGPPAVARQRLESTGDAGSLVAPLDARNGSRLRRIDAHSDPGRNGAGGAGHEEDDAARVLAPAGRNGTTGPSGAVKVNGTVVPSPSVTGTHNGTEPKELGRPGRLGPRRLR